MRDYRQEMITSLDNLDAEHRRTQVATKNDEIRASMVRARELFLASLRLMREIQKMADNGDKQAKKILSDLAPRASESSQEGVRALEREMRILQGSSSFDAIDSNTKPSA